MIVIECKQSNIVLKMQSKDKYIMYRWRQQITRSPTYVFVKPLSYLTLHNTILLNFTSHAIATPTSHYAPCHKIIQHSSHSPSQFRLSQTH